MYIKYPRTMYLPGSPGTTSDDRILASIDHLLGQHVLITEKLDGENTTMYSDHIHARSLDSANHPSRTMVKALHGEIAHEIPAGWRVCGENVYAKHSIFYDNLQAYFYAFSVWDETNTALSWRETVAYLDILGLQHVPVLFEGVLTEDVLDKQVKGLNLEKQEGFVVRLAAPFKYEDFGTSVAKWVRKGHVQTDQHWMQAAIVPNRLGGEK